MDELAAAVRDLKKSKTPGLCGLTAEFFQFFYSKLKEYLFKAITLAKKKGILHTSARKGVITLIPKKLKDPMVLKNWRPLTMLSIDYKVLATILAKWLKQLLPKLISTHQSGFMKGRQISNTLRVSLDLTKYAKNIQGYYLSLDYEKCFDKIEYNAILGALKFFDFGDTYCDMVKLLLYDFESCTINNGFCSEFFGSTGLAIKGARWLRACICFVAKQCLRKFTNTLELMVSKSAGCAN